MNALSASRPMVDLASCANPDGWLVPPLPAAVWQLPATPDDGLEAIAANYYGNSSLFPLPGLPAAISILPRLFPPAMVACCGALGDEHPQAWLNARHRPASDLLRFALPRDEAGWQRLAAALANWNHA